jgi:hypothetical protein
MQILQFVCQGWQGLVRRGDCLKSIQLVGAAVDLKAGSPDERLERLTKPLHEVPADQAGRESMEGLVNVEPTLIANDESAKLAKPRQGPLDDPAHPAGMSAGIDLLAGNAIKDPPGPQHRMTAGVIVALVGMQLRRPRAGPAAGAADRRHCRQQGPEQMAVIHVGRGQVQGQRDTLAVGQHMALRARFAAIRWIRAGTRPPFFAGTMAESMHARDQSI